MKLIRVPLCVEVIWANNRPRPCWWDYIDHLAWEYLGIPQKELEDVAGEKIAQLSLLPL